MDQLQNEIRVAYLDADVNALLASIPEAAPGSAKASPDGGLKPRYGQGEELFLELDSPVLVPRFRIHHDYRRDEPAASYADALRELVRQLVDLLPDVFRGLTYFFDPSEILKPCFYRLYKVEDSVYLYLLRLDLQHRPFIGDIVEAGTNEITPAYSTVRLYLESELIPLEAVMWESGRARAFRIRQLVSNTWIGETGRGYMVHGVWQDNDLTKFFSKLVLPEGVRVYPYFPLYCKYKTVCAQAPFPGPEFRKRILPLLHRAISFLTPRMDEIQQSLKGKSAEHSLLTPDALPVDAFSETMPTFVELRGKVPAAWREVFKGLSARAYLDSRDMKEFALEISPSQA